ncbi:hypothetical protein RZ760_008835, partial [Providencia rettgeri]|nr:hypothetical protein [Providencia rettgeri]
MKNKYLLKPMAFFVVTCFSSATLADITEGATGDATAIAIGYGSRADYENSIALGDRSITDRENSISVGTIGKERTITNVRQGTESTDAVNVGQIHKLRSDLINNTNTEIQNSSNNLKEIIASTSLINRKDSFGYTDRNMQAAGKYITEMNKNTLKESKEYTDETNKTTLEESKDYTDKHIDKMDEFVEAMGIVTLKESKEYT